MSVDLEAVRSVFRAGRCHHIVIPGLVVEQQAALLRTHITELGFESLYEPDCGRYEINYNLVIPNFFDELRDLVELIIERPAELSRARWLRLRHRDYALTKDDAKTRPEGTHIEVTVDFSAQSVGQGDIVYTDGVQSWPVAVEPASAAIVERDAALYRYDRYLDHRIGTQILHRLRLVFS